MAQLDKKTAPGDFSHRPGETFDVYFNRTSAEFKKLSDVSDNLKPGEIVGAILRFPCADGYAVYRVSKERPLTLQHVPYGDAWHVDPALIRGLRRADVERMVEQHRRLQSIFSVTFQ